MPLGTDTQTDRPQTQTDRQTDTHTHMNQSNFKKPGTDSLRPRTPGLKLDSNIMQPNRKFVVNLLIFVR